MSESLKKWNQNWKSFVRKNRAQWLFGKRSEFVDFLTHLELLDLKETNVSKQLFYVFHYRGEVFSFDYDIFCHFRFKSEKLRLYKQELKELENMLLEDLNTESYIQSVQSEKEKEEWEKRKKQIGSKIVDIKKEKDRYVYVLDNGQEIKNLMISVKKKK